MKLCKDCRYIYNSLNCSYGKELGVDYVWGGKRLDPRMQCALAQEIRENGSSDYCGPDARWFEPKEMK